MKNKHILKTVALITLFALNVHWFDVLQDGVHLTTVNAQERNDFQLDFDFDREGGGFDFLGTVPDDIPTSFITQTQTVPNPPGAASMSCAWECGEGTWYDGVFGAIPQMCTEADEMVADIRADIAANRTGDWDGDNLWGDDSVYSAGERIAWDGLWVWKKYNITTGIGWTGWWVGLARYCEANGYWSSSNKDDIEYGSFIGLEFTIAGTDSGRGVYSLKSEPTKTNSMLRMEGKYTSGSSTPARTVTTPVFNSPFIYLEVPDGQYIVTLDSEWDQYQSVSPEFTQESSWSVNVTQADMYVGDEVKDHLFYELGMHRIDLERNGLNFETKEALIAYLQDSDFFAKLNMSEVEKSNSLGYLVPKLPESENYYLTVLSDEAIAALSKITVTPAPDNLVRTYYAVYPTSSAVKTEGGLEFPGALNVTGSTVKEYGEIIVKPEMYVFWK